jgi:TPR repeat protein
LVAGIYEACVKPDPAARPKFYHIVEALYNSPDPPFPGAKGDTYRDYKETVFARTLQSFEAEEVFNQPVESEEVKARFQVLKQRADRGDVEGELQLAQCYHNGTGCRQSFPDAFIYYSRAAEKGSPLAKCYVGRYLRDGRGGERDINRAFQLLREAAQLGVTRAMQELGVMYLRGDGIGKNPAEGMRYLREGAQRDDLECQCLYARNCYQTPEVRNLAEAHHYYRLAHDRGYESASCDYALMLIMGDGVAQNVAEGLRIYKQAATRNNAAALVNLGSLYTQGKYVPKDDTVAAGYYGRRPISTTSLACCTGQITSRMGSVESQRIWHKPGNFS